MVKSTKYFFTALIVLLVITLFSAVFFGAVHISFFDMFSSLQHFIKGNKPANIHQAVFLQLRLPRVLMCAITGAILAVSGVIMQGLFRNPIVEPGLVGTSAGAAFGASIIFVLAPFLSPSLKSLTGPLLVPIFAFAGGLAATYLVYKLSQKGKYISVMSLLLVGIAINAVGLSGTGFMSYIARDPQARSISFWNLGTFAGATWLQAIITITVAIFIFIISFRYAKHLNALLLGEEEAGYLGVNTRQLKSRLMLLNTAMVSVCTAFVGVISFMGLIVPHVMRLIVGSDNKILLPASMLAGAILLTWADMGARLLLAPAEIPIGIITSLVGAPVFIFLLRKIDLFQHKGGYND